MEESIDQTYINIKAFLSEQNCDYDSLKSRMTIVYPYGKLKMKKGDKLLLLGEIPVKQVE